MSSFRWQLAWAKRGILPGYGWKHLFWRLYFYRERP